MWRSSAIAASSVSPINGAASKDAQPIGERALHHGAEAIGIERLEHPLQHARGAAPEPPLLRRLGQEAAGRAGDVEPLHPPRHHRGGEEIVLEEIGERVADPVLVARHDRGVRDRHAERVAEQGGHREPIGDAADQPRLGEGADEAPGRMGVGEVGDGDEHRRHAREHRRRQRPHAARPGGRAVGTGATEQAHRAGIASGGFRSNPAARIGGYSAGCGAGCGAVVRTCPCR